MTTGEFADIVFAMREAQKEYFKYRLHTAFKKGHWSVEKGTIGAQKRTA